MPKISDAKKTERRHQILAAAMACFARKGFQTTTIQDICAEARLSAGAVYSYFESKDAIIGALAARGREAAALRAARTGDKTGLIEQLRAFVDEFRLPGASRVNQLDLRSWAEAIGNRQLRETYLAARDEILEALTAITEPTATARDLDPRAVAELILAVIVGCETRRAIQPTADVVPVFDVLIDLLAGRS